MIVCIIFHSYHNATPRTRILEERRHRGRYSGSRWVVGGDIIVGYLLIRFLFFGIALSHWVALCPLAGCSDLASMRIMIGLGSPTTTFLRWAVNQSWNIRDNNLMKTELGACTKESGEEEFIWGCAAIEICYDCGADVTYLGSDNTSCKLRESLN